MGHYFDWNIRDTYMEFCQLYSYNIHKLYKKEVKKGKLKFDFLNFLKSYLNLNNDNIIDAVCSVHTIRGYEQHCTDIESRVSLQASQPYYFAIALTNR